MAKRAVFADYPPALDWGHDSRDGALLIDRLPAFLFHISQSYIVQKRLFFIRNGQAVPDAGLRREGFLESHCGPFLRYLNPETFRSSICSKYGKVGPGSLSIIEWQEHGSQFCGFDVALPPH